MKNLYPDRAFELRSDGGTEFDNNDVNDFFGKNDISWIKVSKPGDNPFAERGIRTIKHEYVNQVWISILIIKHQQRSELQQQATTRNIHLPENWGNGMLSIALYWVEQNRQYVNGHYT